MSKLNLGCGTDIRIGYENIDLFPQGKDVKMGNFKSLNYQKESVDEILALDILKYINTNEIMPILNSWFEMLTKDGKLKIESTDYNLLCNAASHNYIDANTLNAFLYSQEKIPYSGIYNLVSIEMALKQIGFKIVSKFYSDFSFTIVASK